MTAAFKLSTAAFNRTLREYEKISKRDVPTILNTKAFFIARRAVIETPKADYGKMAHELGQLLAIRTHKKTGKRYLSSRGLGHINNAAGGTAPLLALIINARRGRKGEPGLYGAEMQAEFRHIIAVRARAIAFFKSLWLPTIKTLAPLAEKGGAPKQEAGVKQVGQTKGFAIPAQAAWIARCVFGCTANVRHEHNDAARKYMLPALQRAFDFERSSMLEYMRKKQAEAARRAGIKFGRRLGR